MLPNILFSDNFSPEPLFLDDFSASETNSILSSSCNGDLDFTALAFFALFSKANCLNLLNANILFSMRF